MFAQIVLSRKRTRGIKHLGGLAIVPFERLGFSDKFSDIPIHQHVVHNSRPGCGPILGRQIEGLPA